MVNTIASTASPQMPNTVLTVLVNVTVPFVTSVALMLYTGLSTVASTKLPPLLLLHKIVPLLLLDPDTVYVA
ncbi:hypothetical protein KDA23_04145, partial [Candidatus Saccharibacteria bacterium]|nr:hypothetical protein [Candidatus Saccharibacteria bacterium]